MKLEEAKFLQQLVEALEKGVEKKITHPIPNYLSVKVKSKTGSIEENQWLR